MAAYEEDDNLTMPKWFLQIDEEDAEACLYLIAEGTNKYANEDLTDELKEMLGTRFNIGQEVHELYAYLRSTREKDRNDSIPEPPRNPLPHKLLFSDDGDINVDLLKSHLSREGRISHDDALEISTRANAILKKEPNLLELSDPITIAGDIHGQYFDLLRLFHVGGDPSDTQYLFLGDYVDRGCFSCEVIFLLFAYKIKYPDTFHMLRGNHECRHLSEFFNFMDECKYKYDLNIYEHIMNTFDSLPLAAVVNNRFLCVHGGLSPDIRLISEINNIFRFQEVPRKGPFCDLLWADPGDDSPEASNTYNDWFFPNTVRHCSYKFGTKAVQFFLHKNGLTAIIRGHEVFPNGYQMHFKRGNTPQVFTIFSAPNYCDVYGNKASVLKIKENALNIRQFVWSAHPYYLPNFMDVFSWSLPFVAEKVTNMLDLILKQVSKNVEIQAEEREEAEFTVAVPKSNETTRNLKQKVLAVTKIMQMYKTLREEQENLHLLKQLSPNQQLPHGIISEGSQAIADAVASFESTKEVDRSNEAMPNPGKVTLVRQGTMFSNITEEEQEQELENAKSSQENLLTELE